MLWLLRQYMLFMFQSMVGAQCSYCVAHTRRADAPLTEASSELPLDGTDEDRPAP